MLRPKSPRKEEMIEFLGQTPTDMMSGFGGILIVLRRLL
jgi:hypothetical protein